MSSWLKQYGAISWNSLVVTLGSPFSLILQVSILACGALLACLPFFTFGEQLRLIRDQSLALCFLGGCLAAAVGAAVTVGGDIRRGAAGVIMSRPVDPFCFIAGKWTGLVGSIAVIQVTAASACLWLTDMTASELELDTAGLGAYVLAVLVGLGVMGAKHYLFGGCYVWQANLAVLVCFCGAFLLALLSGSAADVHWPTALASVLVVLALLVYASIATLLAVLCDTGLQLGLCVLVFFFGLLSEYIVRAALGGGMLLTSARALLPNWQLFWVSDRLAEGEVIRLGFVAGCAVHAVCYAAVVLLGASALFRRRELGNAT